MTSRVVPPVLGHVEVPASAGAVRHNGRLVRFRGWITSPNGRPTVVRVHVPGEPPRDVAPSIDRPDVVEAIAGEFGTLDPRVGFDFYVDLPRRRPWRRAPGAIELELTDGESSIPNMTYRVEERSHDYLETYDGDSAAKRELAARWLHGRGLEFGALHQPLHVDPTRASVQYADQLSREQLLETFPEVATRWGDAVVDPDFLVDLNRDDLGVFEVEQFDFFVANDVIEHLANPIRFLTAVYAVMKPRARLFLSVPDLRFTEDARRRPTRRAHLWREYRAGVTDVDDRHLHRFFEGMNQPVPKDPEERAALFDEHRRRSIHVHAWTEDTFDRLLRDVCERIPLHLDVVARSSPFETAGSIVYVLERRADP